MHGETRNETCGMRAEIHSLGWYLYIIEIMLLKKPVWCDGWPTSRPGKGSRGVGVGTDPQGAEFDSATFHLQSFR